MSSYSIRLTSDKARIHAFLQRDPIYAAYAIGDLETEQFARCTWYLAERAGEIAALALVYRGLEPPVLMTMGAAEGLAAIFATMAPLPALYMSAQVEHLPLFQARCDFSGDRVRPMLRMAVTPDNFWPVEPPDGRHYPFARLNRLGPDDAQAVNDLIALGGPYAPDAFSRSQLWNGVFWGIELSSMLSRESLLAAVAGTHLVAPNWGVAALGNVYTHPAYRGRGYAQMLSSAVTEELLLKRLQVVLNVDRGNEAAIHIYRKLGYQVHCPFFEGIGVIRDA